MKRTICQRIITGCLAVVMLLGTLTPLGGASIVYADDTDTSTSITIRCINRVCG